jgi:hypothetical protein
VAVLRLEDGSTYVGLDAINAHLAPSTVAAVPVPTGIDDLLAAERLDDDGVRRFLAHADPDLVARTAAEGWPPPLAQVFWPGMPQPLEELLAGFGPPHTNPVDEVHHVLDGAVEFGFVLADGGQALLVVQPGDALRINRGSEHWSVLTTDHRVKTHLYLSEPPGYAHRYTSTVVRIR